MSLVDLHGLGVDRPCALPCGRTNETPNRFCLSRRVSEKVTVEMQVLASKDRLRKYREIYLDSETNSRGPKNLASRALWWKSRKKD